MSVVWQSRCNGTGFVQALPFLRTHTLGLCRGPLLDASPDTSLCHFILLLLLHRLKGGKARRRLLCTLGKSQWWDGDSERRLWASSLILGALLAACTSVVEITTTADWKESWEVTSFLSLLFLSSACHYLAFSWQRDNRDSWKGPLLLGWLGNGLLEWCVMLLALPFRLDLEPC